MSPEGKGLYVTGFIDVDLWNKATWRATFVASDMQNPPFLGLAFENEKAAKEIFQGWHARFGNADEYEELRISIVEGDIPGEDSGYTVHVGANLENVYKRADTEGLDIPKDYAVNISRLNRMNPDPSSKNLPIFKQEYRKHGQFLLIPGIIKNGNVQPLMDLAIVKKEIFFRDVKDIGEDDLDYVVVKKQ